MSSCRRYSQSIRIAALAVVLSSSGGAAAAGAGPRAGAQRSPDAAVPAGIYLGFDVGPINFIRTSGPSDPEMSIGEDFEGRIGYSFERGAELYLSVARDAKSELGLTRSVWQLAGCAQVHFLVGRRAMLYLRGGLGFAISDNLDTPRSTQIGAGLGEVVGLGVEVRLTPEVSLGLEPFYRHAQLTNGGLDTGIHVVGVQLAIAYY